MGYLEVEETLSAVALTAVGKDVGGLSVTDSSGTKKLLSDFRGKKLLITLLSQQWDPSSGAKLTYYREALSHLGEEEATLVGLTHDQGSYRAEFEDDETIEIPLFSFDSADRQVARELGIVGEEAVILVDENSIIRWYANDLNRNIGDLEDLLRSIRPKKPGLSRRNFLSAAVAASIALSVLPHLAKAGAKAGSAPGEVKTVPTSLNVNGKTYRLNLDPRATVLDTLREDLGLTGSKKGCGHGQCGACTVHIDGRRVNSCLSLSVMQQGKKITTVEGLAKGDQLHPVQAAFIEHDAFQCGYCTSGQIMSAVACIKEGHTGSDDEIREWMSGNICRCGAYVGILAAVKDAKDKGGSI